MEKVMAKDDVPAVDVDKQGMGQGAGNTAFDIALKALARKMPVNDLEERLLGFRSEDREQAKQNMSAYITISEGEDVEPAFLSEENVLGFYYRLERLLMDEYSNKYTFEVLIKQEREKVAKATQERINIEQERVNIEQEIINTKQARINAEQKRLNIEQERLNAEQERLNIEQAELDIKNATPIKLVIARGMLELGIEMERIVQMSGLSEGEIRGN